MGYTSKFTGQEIDNLLTQVQEGGGNMIVVRLPSGEEMTEEEKAINAEAFAKLLANPIAVLSVYLDGLDISICTSYIAPTTEDDSMIIYFKSSLLPLLLPDVNVSGLVGAYVFSSDGNLEEFVPIAGGNTEGAIIYTNNPSTIVNNLTGEMPMTSTPFIVVDSIIEGSWIPFGQCFMSGKVGDGYFLNYITERGEVFNLRFDTNGTLISREWVNGVIVLGASGEKTILQNQMVAFGPSFTVNNYDQNYSLCNKQFTCTYNTTVGLRPLRVTYISETEGYEIVLLNRQNNVFETWKLTPDGQATLQS